MALPSSAKENPNPIVFSTTTQKRRRDRAIVGVTALQRYRFDLPPGDPLETRRAAADSGNEDARQSTGDPYCSSSSPPPLSARFPPTAEERSVILALSAAAYHSPDGNDGASKLELLEQAGFSLIDPDDARRRHRVFGTPSYVTAASAVSKERDGMEKCSSGGAPTTKVVTASMTTRRDGIDADEVFDIIRNIQDPEHPLTLEQLNVVRLELINVKDLEAARVADPAVGHGGDNGGLAPRRSKKFSTVHVQFTPTIPHCSMATLIGLSLRVKLLRSLPSRFKVTVQIEPGTHASELAVNKQLADKERVRAALENEHLLSVVNRCILGGMNM